MPTQQPPTILIVDDDAGIRATLAAMLMREDCHLEFAADGVEALEKAAQLRPSAILLDVMMPRMSGYEVCRRIRADPDLAEMPVIMITTLSDPEKRLEGLSAGADDFVNKPFDVIELGIRIRTITRIDRYRRLMAERARFQWMVESADDGYLLVDAADTIRYANARARLQLNLPPDIAGQNFLTIADQMYRRQPADIWQNWRARPDPANQPLYLVQPETPTARSYWLGVDVLPQPDLADDRLLVRLRDVSGLMSNYQDVRKFQTAVSHKLRTPIGTAEASLDLLTQRIESMSSDEIVKFAGVALRGIRRLRTEINDVLDFTQAPLVARRGEPSPLTEIADRIETIGQESGLTSFSLSAPPELSDLRLTISFSAAEIIFLELLENAIKFHPNHAPRVNVVIHQSDPKLICVRISDDGLTLTPQQIQWAWLPYLQGEKYFTGEAPGMGLGLPMVATLVWQIGGTVRLSNRTDGPGVIVELFLPLADS